MFAYLICYLIYHIRSFHWPHGHVLRPEELGGHDVNRNADGLHHRRGLRCRPEVQGHPGQ